MHGVAGRRMRRQFDVEAPDVTAVAEQVALQGVTAVPFLVIQLQATILGKTQPASETAPGRTAHKAQA